MKKAIKVSLNSPDGCVSVEASSWGEFWDKTRGFDPITAFLLESMFRNMMEGEIDATD